MLRFSQLCRRLSLVVLSLFYSCNCSCPEACEPCISGHLNCVTPGLTEIPTSSDPDLQRVTIQKQRFSNGDLSSANFSSFLGINHLSIRTSNINKLMPYTFSNLTYLRTLDLGDNAELIVKQMAFTGLLLQTLKLDNMGMITLDLDAFHGLSVITLSIQNSNLLTLPLRLLQPLSTVLLKLYLKNNLLRTLDPLLQPIFQSLEVLELQKNPFNCNCSILWLSKLLQLSASKISDSNSQESTEERYPSCVSPAEFRKQFLHTIPSKLKNCSPPSIVRIDVTFQSLSSAVIDCFADSRKDVYQDTFVGWFSPTEHPPDVSQLRRSVKVDRQSLYQIYVCRAANAIGNSELRFQIDWLKLPKEMYKQLSNASVRSNHTRINQSILWRNAFSLFEMLCAIVGTLMITVMIFVVFCCCHRCRLQIPFFEMGAKSIYKIPPQYERAICYDDRRFCETDVDGNFFPPPPPPTPPPFSLNRMML